MASCWGRPWPSDEMPFLARALTVNPDGLATEDEEGASTYRDLLAGADDVARRLMTLGIRAGDLIAVAGPMGRAVVAALHGVWRAGGAVLPLNERWTAGEVAGAFQILAPRMALDGAEGGVGREVEGGLPIPATEIGTFSLASKKEPRHPRLSRVGPSPDAPPLLASGDVAASLLTSGTSGRPKPVRISVGNLLASAEGARERLGLGPEDRWLGSLSLAHVGGLALVTRTAILGSGLVLPGRFRGDTFLSLVEERSVTHASLVPTMLYQVLEEGGGAAAPASLRCILVGGGPAREDLVRSALNAGLPIALTYGLSEASSQVATAPPALVKDKPGTVGPPLTGVTVRITRSGELLVKGPTVAPGQAGEDEWLHTGDLAWEDEDRHLWITGRISDRIISGGVGVDPIEVERVLESHPAVEEAAVVGVADVEWGERVVGFVVSRGGGKEVERELDALARKALSPAKRPRAFHFLDSLPRNSNGKVERERLKSLHR